MCLLSIVFLVDFSSIRRTFLKFSNYSLCITKQVSLAYFKMQIAHLQIWDLFALVPCPKGKHHHKPYLNINIYVEPLTFS